MGRIMAIDFGTKRIGLAVTDPLQIIASPLETVHPKDFELFLKEYMKKEEVDEFVIGYPVQLNNKPSESVTQLNPFIRRLRQNHPGKTVHLVDERFTSQMAMRAMIDGGLKKKERMDKSIVDRVSASLILQSFLESRANKRENKS